MAAASVRLDALSLARMFDTWTLAVLAEMNSSAAISRLLRPAATSRSTSAPRGGRPRDPEAGAPGQRPYPLAERAGAKPVRQRGGAGQSLGRTVPVAHVHRGLGT